MIFSKIKYNDIFFVDNGGWHFSYLNTAELIEEKLKSYAHHRDCLLYTSPSQRDRG